MNATRMSNANGKPQSWTVVPYLSTHNGGGTPMGTDPKTSVLNQYGQSWDVKNLFVADGSVFVSNADKNPTLSILALAWRTCDHIMAEMKRGNI
jgi:choline dehydrogenase-like flavoprotein